MNFLFVSNSSCKDYFFLTSETKIMSVESTCSILFHHAPSLVRILFPRRAAPPSKKVVRPVESMSPTSQTGQNSYNLLVHITDVSIARFALSGVQKLRPSIVSEGISVTQDTGRICPYNHPT